MAAKMLLGFALFLGGPVFAVDCNALDSTYQPPPLKHQMLSKLNPDTQEKLRNFRSLFLGEPSLRLDLYSRYFDVVGAYLVLQGEILQNGRLIEEFVRELAKHSPFKELGIEAVASHLLIQAQGTTIAYKDHARNVKGPSEPLRDVIARNGWIPQLEPRLLATGVWLQSRPSDYGLVQLQPSRPEEFPVHVIFVHSQLPGVPDLVQGVEGTGIQILGQKNRNLLAEVDLPGRSDARYPQLRYPGWVRFPSVKYFERFGRHLMVVNNFGSIVVLESRDHNFKDWSVIAAINPGGGWEVNDAGARYAYVRLPVAGYDNLKFETIKTFHEIGDYNLAVDSNGRLLLVAESAPSPNAADYRRWKVYLIPN